MSHDFGNLNAADQPNIIPELHEMMEIVEVVQHMDMTPRGQEVVVSGDTEGDKAFNHLQGDNDLGFRGTCGLVSCEDILRQHGVNVTENDIVHYAADNHLCNTSGDDPDFCGGTSPETQARILESYGVPAHAERGQTLETVAERLEKGQSAIVEVNAGVAFDNPGSVGQDPYRSNHAIVVTGVARDPQTGEIAGFYVNDSGGFCMDANGQVESSHFVDAQHMQMAFVETGGQCVVTDVARADTQTAGDSGQIAYGNDSQDGNWYWSDGSKDTRYTWK